MENNRQNGQPVLKRLRKILANAYKKFTFEWCYPAIYKIESRKPLEDKAVFLERRDKDISDNFRLIYDKLKEKGNIRLVFRSIGEGRSSVLRIWLNNASFIRAIGTAKYVFINDSSELVSCITPRKGTQIVQVWHACGAFKKFGYSTSQKLFGASLEDLEKHPLHKNFSLVAVSSSDVIWAYAEAFHMEDHKERIRALGVSRTDVFYDPERIRKALEKIHTLVPRTKDKKIILYAPTFRGPVKSAASPDEMDLKLMKEALGDKYVILNKHHPFVKKRPVIPAEFAEFSVDVTDELSIEELLMASDICISDYSSLIFEYSLFERPMLFFAYDLDEYFDWRGFYYNYDEMAPGPICKTTEEMAEYIKNIETSFDKQRIKDFKEKFMSACDGHATDRLLDIVLDEKNEG